MTETSEARIADAAESAAHHAVRVDRIFEVISAIMLGVVALATAWSGYQAARWGGEQAADYNLASTKRVEAATAANRAGFLASVDVAVFSNWVNAYAQGNQELADFYRQRFRAEFVPAFDAWIAMQPRTNPKAPPTPFAMPEYQLQAQNDADQFEAEANTLFQQGQIANDVSDQYVLSTVIMASVLFFLAIEERFDWVRVRAVITVIALALLIFGLITLATYPIN